MNFILSFSDVFENSTSMIGLAFCVRNVLRT
jgi:hypothetical protein